AAGPTAGLRRSSLAWRATPPRRSCRTGFFVRRPDRDSSRRLPPGRERDELLEADRFLPARADFASPAHGTASANRGGHRQRLHAVPASPATGTTVCVARRG